MIFIYADIGPLYKGSYVSEITTISQWQIQLFYLTHKQERTLYNILLAELFLRGSGQSSLQVADLLYYASDVQLPQNSTM